MQRTLPLAAILALLLSAIPGLVRGTPVESWKAASPDGSVATTLTQGTNGFELSVRWRNQTILEHSRISLRTDDNDWSLATVDGTASTRNIRDQYQLPERPVVNVDATECSLPLRTPSGARGFLDLHLEAGGLGWRFRVDAKPKQKVQQELSAWNLPLETMLWFQPEVGYEGIFDGAVLKDLLIKPFRYGGEREPFQLPMPVTAQLPTGGYALLTEAAVYDFADSAFRVGSKGRLELVMRAQTGGWTTDDPVVQPWRVLILAKDLTDLVNNHLVQNLNPPAAPELAHADWIQPGSSTWQWWSSGSPKWEEQSAWLDWTKALGFRYYLVDDGWKRWHDGSATEWELLGRVCKEGSDKGVKIWLWVHSNEVATPETMTAYMDRAVQAGVVGLKIDFVPPANRTWSSWYLDVLREAAKRRLMVDFHGATKPTGIERTWPNEITRESIRGHEYHIHRYNRMLPPQHDTILPFTRMVIGHADYTPVVFNPAELNGYDWPRELAQAIVLSSPFLCFADHPKFYLENPALDVIKGLPQTWDETRVLPPSEIGECALFARRKGGSWYVGLINGATPKHFTLPLDFLGEKTYAATLLRAGKEPNAFDRKEEKLTGKDKLELQIGGSSGFVARLEPLP